MSHLFEIRPFNGLAGIDQCALHRGMPQGALDEFQRYAFIIHQLPGRMAQAVRRVGELRGGLGRQLHLLEQTGYCLMQISIGEAWKQRALFNCRFAQIGFQVERHRFKKDNDFFGAGALSFPPNGEEGLSKIKITCLEPLHFHGTKAIVGHQRYDRLLTGSGTRADQFCALFQRQAFFVVELARSIFGLDGQHILERLDRECSQRSFYFPVRCREFFIGAGEIPQRPPGKGLYHRTIQRRGEGRKSLGENKPLCRQFFKVVKLTDKFKVVVEDRGISAQCFSRPQPIARGDQEQFDIRVGDREPRFARILFQVVLGGADIFLFQKFPEAVKDRAACDTLFGSEGIELGEQRAVGAESFQERFGVVAVGAHGAIMRQEPLLVIGEDFRGGPEGGGETIGFGGQVAGHTKREKRIYEKL